jgi:NADH-quinone oxidoreductase subunit D
MTDARLMIDVVGSPECGFGVYLVSDESNKPYKCKIRVPSYAHLQAMDFPSRGTR